MDHTPTMAYTSATEIARRTRSGEVTARAVTEFFLARIHALNPILHAFTRVLHTEALAAADALDALPAGERGPLHGVPIAIKGEVDVRGMVTHHGSAAFTTPARRDSEVVRRLRAAGAVIVGQTALPELSIWPYTESNAFGYALNPWSLEHSPSGSSGGSAAAVSAGMVPAALGGDGGGSIRLPAAWCGLFGLKPQRGRVSTGPNPSLWGDLGTLGPLTRTVEDSLLLYGVIQGHLDGVDEHSAGPLTVPGDGPLRIAWSTAAPFPARPTRETRRAVAETARLLEKLGHEVDRIDFTYPRDLTAAFVPQYLAGFGATAARAEKPGLVERRTRQAARIGRLTRLTAPGTVDAARERGRRAGRAVTEKLFGTYDLFLTPTVPHAAPRIGQLDGLGFLRAALKASRVASLTAPWNVAGNPAAAVPAGFDARGLPLSVQLVGPPDGELIICEAAAQLQAERRWEDAHPPIEVLQGL